MPACVRVTPLGVLDCLVDRNTYGRQAQSFEADVAVSWELLGAAGDPAPFPGVFIRAPGIKQCGPDVEVVAELNSLPVLVRQGAILAATFHPELSDDHRLHRAVLKLAELA